MKHLFIVNPVAGGRDHTQPVSRAVAEAFSHREDEYEIYVTKAPKDAITKIRSAAGADELRVYACGGDGTLNECVNGAAGLRNVAVTHYPCGTGNDFIKLFGEERSRFLRLDELLDGELRPIDLIRVGDVYGLNICSVGVDARIGTDVHKYSRLPGGGAYIASVAVNFFKGLTQPMEISVDGQTFSGRHSLVCVCNGRYYGGGFNPVPDARPDDGVLDVLIVRGVSRLAFASLIGNYAKGNYAKSPQYITRVAAKSLTIRTEGTSVVNVDGEAAYGSDIHMEVVPGGIDFIFPRGMAYFPEPAKQFCKI